jgi:hypothetical protein
LSVVARRFKSTHIGAHVPFPRARARRGVARRVVVARVAPARARAPFARATSGANERQDS